MHRKVVTLKNLKGLYPKLNEAMVLKIIEAYKNGELDNFDKRCIFDSENKLYRYNSDTWHAFRYVTDYREEGSNFYNLIPEKIIQKYLKCGIFLEQDFIRCYFEKLENEAEIKDPKDRNLIDEVLIYGIKYREECCIEAEHSNDPSW